MTYATFSIRPALFTLLGAAAGLAYCAAFGGIAFLGPLLTVAATAYGGYLLAGLMEE